MPPQPPRAPPSPKAPQATILSPNQLSRDAFKRVGREMQFRAFRHYFGCSSTRREKHRPPIFFGVPDSTTQRLSAPKSSGRSYR